jgi:hypothetical protein
MSKTIDNLVLEQLKKIRFEQEKTSERIDEVFMRLSTIESGIARIAISESGNYSEIVQDRHIVDKLRDRVDLIERRLEIAS